MEHQTGSRNGEGNRYKRLSPNPRSQEYKIGKSMTEHARERFHYLCASIQGKFILIDHIPPKIDNGQFFDRQGLDFSPYKDYKLQPILGIKLFPRTDGTVHPDELKMYHEQFANSWRHSEGGILHNMNDKREFYNCILNYHSLETTTGNAEWDAFFEKLKESGYDKSLVPCAHFGTLTGCMDIDCPFLHDEEMFRERRNKILASRRKALFEPTPKQRFQHMQKTYKSKKKPSRNESALVATLDDLDGDDGDETDDEETKIKVPRVRHFCANMECMKPWLRKQNDVAVLQKCARCQWTFYCSVRSCLDFGLLSVTSRTELSIDCLPETRLASSQVGLRTSGGDHCE
ncbi:hypothetical protein SCHPADRAFT_855020 [Schizopora paradoxa]|uniref:C3H1-type domain-containing protein n=1 Tax=Schizopora paradoxa TaxID=27342 RepID=A0A0H2RJ60_9AGAM|nr:hypothetical protein SCHPADRAFT_855020 [Schizopora paradoxa]